MKKIIKGISTFLSLLILSLVLTTNNSNAQSRHNGSYDEFYEDLAPYGQWIDDPSYGYVWCPSVGDGFRPYYSSGHWIMTEYGNMWASDYSWGWAPFHYGRWSYDSYYGWFWIPGSEWGPAWVSWRHSNNYYGWAPMGPGISISISYGSYNPPSNWWVFIPPTYIHQSNWYNYHHNINDNMTIINNTTYINNTYIYNGNTYVTGPRSEEIKRFTNRQPVVYKVGSERSAGKMMMQNNQVNVYRPQIQKSGKEARPPQSINASQPIGKPQAVNSNGKPQRMQQANGGQKELNMRVSDKQNQKGQERIQKNNEGHQDARPVDRKLNDSRSIQHEQPQRQDKPQRQDRPQQRQEQPRQQQSPQPQRQDRPQRQEQPQRQQAPQAQRQEKDQPSKGDRQNDKDKNK